ncbi:MAG: cytochrome b/b6 domain-containing protein [Steroidobacteraceae bacterium]
MSRARPLVWDLPVRLMHWTTVLAVAGAWATEKVPGDWYRYHVWCGYTVLVLSSTRLVWGWIGTRHARFASFVRGPAQIIRYARSLTGGRPLSFTGHNPLGALMVLLLLALLLTLALTGLFANDEITHTGALYGYVSNETSNRVSGLHATLANVLLGAIALHVTAVLFYLRVKRENLIVPMITGRKPVERVGPGQAIERSRTWVALAVALALAALLALIVRAAPEATLVLF